MKCGASCLIGQPMLPLSAAFRKAGLQVSERAQTASSAMGFFRRALGFPHRYGGIHSSLPKPLEKCGAARGASEELHRKLVRGCGGLSPRVPSPILAWFDIIPGLTTKVRLTIVITRDTPNSVGAWERNLRRPITRERNQMTALRLFICSIILTVLVFGLTVTAALRGAPESLGQHLMLACKIAFLITAATGIYWLWNLARKRASVQL